MKFAKNLESVRRGQFAESIKTGKAVIDQEVEQALLKRALGFEYDEIKTELL